MIRCTPHGICSWNFDLRGEGHTAALEFNWLGESGSLAVDGRRHFIDKQGAFSGRWALTEGREALLAAQKSGAFTRRFELVGDTIAAHLRARSPLGRTMELVGNGTHCVIAPDHAFTRRASIVGEFADFRLVAFAFWLTVIIWRRAANSG